MPDKREGSIVAGLSVRTGASRGRRRVRASLFSRAERCCLHTSVVSVLSFATLVLLLACDRAPRENPLLRFDDAPVILISVDTLRADHLPVYGYDRVSTPALDRLRADSILFENAYSHTPLTLPSHVSILTGKLPGEHGVRNNLGYTFDGAKHVTIPALLRSRGYASGAAVSSYVLRGSTGLKTMFDSYDDQIAFRGGSSLGQLQRPGEVTAQSAEHWIADRASAPFFFFLHLFEPHTPYEAPEPFRSQYASSPYDGEIAHTDRIVGRFLDGLRRRGIYDRAIIIFLSDHGEGLGDHGEAEHGVFLYREAIHVPLLLKLPNRKMAGKAVATPVQLIDVLPTIAALTGAVTDPAWKGSSLLTIATETSPANRRIFSETFYPRIHLGLSELRSFIDSSRHYIEAPRSELFDVVRDPAERNNIIGSDRRTVAQLRGEMNPFRVALGVGAAISVEEAANLKALGYLGSTAPSGSDEELADPKDHIADVEVMKSAVALSRSGEPERGTEQLEEIVRRTPRFTDAWVQLAQAYERKGDYPRAAQTYAHVLKLVPGLSEETALSLAAVYLNLEDYDKAESHASLVLKRNPGAAHLLLGRIALARRDLDGSEHHARESMRHDSFRLSAEVLLAQTLIKRGRARVPEALALVEKAKAEIGRTGASNVKMLDFVRGDALAKLGRIQEAEEAFREEIQAFPDSRNAYSSLAVLLFLQGNRAAAGQTMEALVRANPAPASYELAADVMQKMGDRGAADAWRRRIKR